MDRHLLGLKLCVKDDEKMPALFSDAAFGKSSYWRLSTSNVSSEHFVCWGFGEVVPEGFGVAYTINNDSIACTITSRHLGAVRFSKSLEKALIDMRALCQSAMQGKSKL